MRRGVDFRKLEEADVVYTIAQIISVLLVLGSIAYLIGYSAHYKTEAKQWQALEAKRLSGLGSICQLATSCSSWTDCSNGMQERVCKNRCANTVTKETKECTAIPVTPPATGSKNILTNISVYSDAYVVRLDDKSNFGNKISLQVSLKSSDIYTSYLKFNLAEVPADSTINSMKLWLSAFRGYSKGILIGVYYCANDSWDERTITGNTQPVCFENETFHFLDAQNVTNESSYTWDVTNLLNMATAGKRIFSFYMKEKTNLFETSRNVISFYSKEAPENIPILIINYTLSVKSGGQSITGKYTAPVESSKKSIMGRLLSFFGF